MEDAEAALREAAAEVHRLQKNVNALAEEAAGLAAAQKTALKVAYPALCRVSLPHAAALAFQFRFPFTTSFVAILKVFRDFIRKSSIIGKCWQMQFIRCSKVRPLTPTGWL